jgi:hypothetical protein
MLLLIKKHQFESMSKGTKTEAVEGDEQEAQVACLLVKQEWNKMLLLIKKHRRQGRRGRNRFTGGSRQKVQKGQSNSRDKGH